MNQLLDDINEEDDQGIKQTFSTIMGYMPSSVDQNEQQIKDSLTMEDVKYLTIK
jgi:hypothetical protein